MALPDSGVPLDIDFRHPYTPYDIQKEFMLALYQCIEQGQVGIFESPTGTGKSLSLLCGSITWLRDHKRAWFTTKLDSTADDEPEWMRAHARTAKMQAMLQRRNYFEERLAALREADRRARQNTVSSDHRSKRAKTVHNVDDAEDVEAKFALDDYDSDDGTSSANVPRRRGDDLSDETKALMKKLGLPTGSGGAEEDCEPEDELKIYISSRTHSQLSQLVAELRKVSFLSTLPSAASHDEEFPIEAIKQLSLGSRKNLCINDKVKSLASTTAINEKCLELQEPKKSTTEAKCKFLPSKENEGLVLDFKHYALSKVRDIEDLAGLGTKLGVCPYYASRPAIGSAEIVTLPYPLLLQQSSREALKLSVKDHVVIIDEAHNLMDAILGIHTTEISLAQLDRCRVQVMTYLQKFRGRLAGKNRVYLSQVVRLLDSLRMFLAGLKSASKDGSTKPSEMMAGNGVDQINLYKLAQYMQDSKLARKVHGYTEHKQNIDDEQIGRQHTKRADSVTGVPPVLESFQSFTLALTNPAKEGRFFWQKSADPAETKLKYLLLDPSEHFRDIVESARSVVLVGGTMSPMSDYASQLFPFLSPSRITTLSCKHVMPPSNLLVSTVSTGFADVALDFTFGSRNSPALLQSLGETLLRLLPLVPDGAVIFFPSYGYLEAVLSSWRSPQSSSPSPQQTSIFSRLQAIKPLFVDSRSANTEQLLRDYSAAITSAPIESQATSSPPHRGACLFSVIGGRLSEGINFSDRLGRCVVVVGLPYPNPHAAEWKARMEFVEERAAAVSAAPSTMFPHDTASSAVSTETSGGAGKAAKGKAYVRGEASREFAENACMRSVNQAIGRAIRHKDDWAAIVLLDARYERPRVRAKLPGWMAPSLTSGGTGLVHVRRAMGEFYARKEWEDRP